VDRRLEIDGAELKEILRAFRLMQVAMNSAANART
jgi:hypothetical protein